MDTLSVAQVAALLGTSVPRVRRAMDRLDLEPERGPQGRQLTPDQVEVLRTELGEGAPVDGFSREGMRVLAALNRRPLGVRSARAVARAAGVSPTVASRTIESFVHGGLVSRTEHVLAEGSARTAAVYSLNRDDPTWVRMAGAVRRTELPRLTLSDARARTVPQRLRHHFWNATPADLRLPDNSDYVAARLLRSEDPEAISWAGTHLDRDSIEKVAGLRGLDARDRGWLHTVASQR